MEHYVYKHVDPRTGETRYVGCGTKGRAWFCGSGSAEFGKRGNRLRDHQKWLRELLKEGFTPADFVVVVEQRLTKKAAHSVERALLRSLDVSRLFNKPMGVHCLRMTKEMVAYGHELRASGKTWVEAARLVGVHKMTLWRALTNRTEGLKNV